jgi:hypothetical protein
VVNQFTLGTSAFPMEFASFVDFVGAAEFDKALRKVTRKLSMLQPSIRALYGDRYFFQHQCLRFTDGPTSFQLEPSNPIAVRAASLIGGVNRMRAGLSAPANARFRKVCGDGLTPGRDIRQIEHEIRAFTHFGQKVSNVSLADLEGKGRFDLLCEAQAEMFEVECKTVSEETGSQIKTEMTVNLSEAFNKAVRRALPVNEPGLFVLTLIRPADSCRNLVGLLAAALSSPRVSSFAGTDFTLAFVPRPSWAVAVKSLSREEFRLMVLQDPELKNHAHFVTKVGDCVVGLVLRPHKSSTISERVTGVIKDAADQCSGSNVSLVWLHFIGFAEADFIELAEASMRGNGSGLNAIVADALHPRSSPTDRSHVHSVRFSGDASGITTKPVLDPSFLIVPAVSVSGPCYDVPNPFCRFQSKIDL